MKNLINLLVLISTLLIIGLACDAPKDESNSESPQETTTTNETSDEKPASEPKEEISDITWKEINNIYNIKSDSTDLQKAEAWKTYKGKRVLWEGEVAEIKEGFTSGYNLQIKMNPDTLTSDLLIGLDDSQKQKVIPLKKGNKIKFKGTLSSWGSILPITLDDGEIQ